MERRINIHISVDEYHEADALREIANVLENAEDDEELDGMTFKSSYYIAKVTVEE